MNDNKKTVLEQALEAVRTAGHKDDISDAELGRLLQTFRARLSEREALLEARKHAH